MKGCPKHGPTTVILTTGEKVCRVYRCGYRAEGDFSDQIKANFHDPDRPSRKDLAAGEEDSWVIP